MSRASNANSGAAAWRRLTAIAASLALASAAALCSCTAHAASASTTAPSLGATGSPAARSAIQPAATAPAATTPPPAATVYTGPVPTSPGSGTLTATGANAAKRQPAKSEISTLAIVIAALGALLLLACAAWALARRRAYEPRWWLSLQHSLAEAGYRTSSTWAEFSDWARRGE
jgi:hypothetical protein